VKSVAINMPALQLQLGVQHIPLDEHMF
jgi:hypothetical protein